MIKITHVAKNQLIVHDDEKGERWLQSYASVIAKIDRNGNVTLGKHWKYSVTTSKYRAQFLNESTAETQAKLDSGEYTLDENL